MRWGGLAIAVRDLPGNLRGAGSTLTTSSSGGCVYHQCRRDFNVWWITRDLSRSPWMALCLHCITGDMEHVQKNGVVNNARWDLIHPPQRDRHIRGIFLGYILRSDRSDNRESSDMSGRLSS